MTAFGPDNPAKGRAGKPNRTYRFGNVDIAKATGFHLGTVQRHIREGALDPRDLMSLARYLLEHPRQEWYRDKDGNWAAKEVQ